MTRVHRKGRPKTARRTGPSGIVDTKQKPKRGLNIILVSHCAPIENSGLHIISLAEALAARGHHCLMLFPEALQDEVQVAQGCAAQSYSDYLASPAPFSHGGKPDLVHAWTPREHVRTMTEQIVAATGASYLLHMEDNEQQIVIDDIGVFEASEITAMPDSLLIRMLSDPNRTLPRRYATFAENAAGYTCLIGGLLDFKPEGVPGLVFWPGFDPIFERPISPLDRSLQRLRYGIGEEETVIVYSGTVHRSVLEDSRSLYLAVALLNRRGRKVRLVRTGRDAVDLGIEPYDPDLNLLNLGFVPRTELPGLMAMADLFVQPGGDSPFNRARFPAKVPEFLVSGRPLIIGDVNIGQTLIDGETALKVTESKAVHLADKIAYLIDHPSLAAAIGAAGRTFALSYLNWQVAAEKLEGFYTSLGKQTGPKPRCVMASVIKNNFSVYPVDLIAFYNVSEPSKQRSRRINSPIETLLTDIDLARSYGVSGFCFNCRSTEQAHVLWQLLSAAATVQGFSLTINWLIPSASKPGEAAQMQAAKLLALIASMMQSSHWLKINGEPLLAIEGLETCEHLKALVNQLRKLGRKHGINSLHLAAVQTILRSRNFGTDSLIERPPFLGNITDAAGSSGGMAQDYIAAALKAIHAPPVSGVFPGVFPRWSETAGSLRGYHYLNDSPLAYGQWVRALVKRVLENREAQAPIIFLNAWNNGSAGEGLSPDPIYGQGLLEVTREALTQGIIDFVRPPSPSDDRRFIEAVRRLPRPN